MTHPNLLQRIRAAFSPSLIHPAQLQSYRMPDLERWNMPHRTVDMKDWEVALNMAKNLYRPDRSRLMDLYDSIQKDAHLGSLIETRELRVQGAKYKLVDAKGESKPEHARMLEAPWFLDFVRYVVGARFVGHSLIELGELRAPGQLRQVNLIDPRNVLPYAGVVAKRQGEETGYLFREEPLRSYLIEVGRPEDLGLLERVAPVAVVKKYAIGSWSAFTGAYGIPARWVKTRGNDARRVKQLESVMQNMLSSAYAIIQGDEEFGIAPTPSTSPDALFDKLISRMNSEMSKRLMGQDGTTDNKDASGTYGSMKVLEGVAEDRHESDKTFVQHVINEELMPRLVALGYPFAGLRFEWDEFRDMSAGELVDAVSKLGMLYDIDPKHVEERTGIKILGARRMPGELGPESNPPGNGKQKGGTKPDPEGDDPEGGDDDDDEDDPAYAKATAGKDDDTITAQWPRDTLGTCGVCGGSKDITAEAGPSNLSDEDKQAIFDDLKATDGLFSQHYFSKTADALVGGFRQAWEGDPFSYAEQPDPVAYTVMEANIFKFSGAKTRALAVDINAMVRKSKSYADFKRRVDTSGTFDAYHRYLRTEYANAVNSGMQASRYYAHKRMVDSMPMWRYDTMADDRVRTAHWNLHGRVFMHNDRIWNTIYPPNGWGCRCTVIPTGEYAGDEAVPLNSQQASQYLDAKELTRMERGGFLGNRAKLAEVFKLNASYRTGTRLVFGPWENYADASKQTYDAITARPLPDMPLPFANEAQARVGIFRGAKAINLPDHAGRGWKLSQDNFNHHHTPAYASEERYKIAHLIGDTLSAPDEVWLLGTAKKDRPGRSDYKFIRYYQGKTIVVEARATMNPNGSPVMEIHAWHDATSATIGTHRLGLLVKKNAR